MPFTFLTFLTTSRDSRARTILGWTPGLRSLVGGRVLPCGCLTGIYNTWGGDVVAIIDAKGESCWYEQHGEHSILWRRAPQHTTMLPDDPALRRPQAT